MKTQKVSVDVWAMIQSMLGYLMLAILGGIFLRLVVATLTLPGRLRRQKDDVQRAMRELENRYPDAFKSAMEECADEDAAKEKKPSEVSSEENMKNNEDSDELTEDEGPLEDKKLK